MKYLLPLVFLLSAMPQEGGAREPTFAEAKCSLPLAIQYLDGIKRDNRKELDSNRIKLDKYRLLKGLAAKQEVKKKNLLKIQRTIRQEDKKIDALRDECAQELEQLNKGKFKNTSACLTRFATLIQDLDRKWDETYKIINSNLEELEAKHEPAWLGRALKFAIVGGAMCLFASAALAAMPGALAARPPMAPQIGAGPGSALMTPAAPLIFAPSTIATIPPQCTISPSGELTGPGCSLSETKPPQIKTIPSLEEFQKKLAAQKVALEDYQIEDLRAMFPDFLKVTQLEKKGVNTAILLKDIEGNDHFVKLFFREESQKFVGKDKFLVQFPSLHEAAASQLAHRITGGLVPEGESKGGLAIAFPALQIDDEATKILFKSRFPKFEEEDIFPRLNDKQKEQVFIQLVADWILDNADTHSNQFSLDIEGNFLAFDKGRAHLSEIFEKAALSSPFEINAQTVEKSKVYGNFVTHLRDKPTELRRILSSDAVKQLFERIDSFSDEEITATMAPLFRYLDYQLKREPQGISLADLNRSYVRRFRDIRVHLGRLFGVGANEFVSFSDAIMAREVLHYEHEPSEGIHSTTIDLDKFDVKLINANDYGKQGDTVAGMMKEARALAGINGGFWNYGHHVSWTSSLAFKAFSKAGQIAGVGSDLYYAFPSGILKTERDLVGDSSNFIPCFGWNLETREFIAGDLKIQWMLNGLRLERISHLNYKSQIQFLYAGGKKIKLVKGIVQSIASHPKEPNFGDIQDHNAYRIMDSGKDLSWVAKLKVRDPLAIGYAYVSQPESDAAKWGRMTQIVNGAGVLVKDGVAQAVVHDIGGPYVDTYRTALCSTKDGKVKQVVTGDIKFKNLAKKMVALGCEQALSLDGGGSTGMVLKNGGDYEQLLLERVISDAIVVTAKGTSPNKGGVFDKDVLTAIQTGNLDAFKSALAKNPKVFTARDKEGRTLLHLMIEKGNYRFVQYLIDQAKENASFRTNLSKDVYGETPLDAVLKELTASYDDSEQDPSLAFNRDLIVLATDLLDLTSGSEISEPSFRVLIDIAFRSKNRELLVKTLERADPAQVRASLKESDQLLGIVVREEPWRSWFDDAYVKGLRQRFGDDLVATLTTAELVDCLEGRSSLVVAAIFNKQPSVAERIASQLTHDELWLQKTVLGFQAGRLESLSPLVLALEYRYERLAEVLKAKTDSDLISALTDDRGVHFVEFVHSSPMIRNYLDTQVVPTWVGLYGEEVFKQLSIANMVDGFVAKQQDPKSSVGLAKALMNEGKIDLVKQMVAHRLSEFPVNAINELAGINGDYEVAYQIAVARVSELTIPTWSVQKWMRDVRGLDPKHFQQLLSHFSTSQIALGLVEVVQSHAQGYLSFSDANFQVALDYLGTEYLLHGSDDTVSWLWQFISGNGGGDPQIEKMVALIERLPEGERKRHFLIAQSGSSWIDGVLRTSPQDAVRLASLFAKADIAAKIQDDTILGRALSFPSDSNPYSKRALNFLWSRTTNWDRIRNSPEFFVSAAVLTTLTYLIVTITRGTFHILVLEEEINNLEKMLINYENNQRKIEPSQMEMGELDNDEFTRKRDELREKVKTALLALKKLESGLASRIENILKRHHLQVDLLSLQEALINPFISKLELEDTWKSAKKEDRLIVYKKGPYGIVLDFLNRHRGFVTSLNLTAEDLTALAKSLTAFDKNTENLKDRWGEMSEVVDLKDLLIFQSQITKQIRTLLDGVKKSKPEMVNAIEAVLREHHLENTP